MVQGIQRAGTCYDVAATGRSFLRRHTKNAGEQRAIRHRDRAAKELAADFAVGRDIWCALVRGHEWPSRGIRLPGVSLQLSCTSCQTNRAPGGMTSISVTLSPDVNYAASRARLPP